MTNLSSLEVLVFFLLWSISEKPSEGHFLEETHIYQDENAIVPIYNGSSIRQLLALCWDEQLDNKVYREAEPCDAIEKGLSRTNLGPDAYKARRKERWDDLRKAQETLRLFQLKLKRKTFLIQFGILAANFVLGFYLVVVGHFNPRTIYDVYAHDPTLGIPCWQFLRMRYMASKKLLSESDVSGMWSGSLVGRDNQSILTVEVVPFQKRRTSQETNQKNKDDILE